MTTSELTPNEDLVSKYFLGEIVRLRLIRRCISVESVGRRAKRSGGYTLTVVNRWYHGMCVVVEVLTTKAALGSGRSTNTRVAPQPEIFELCFRSSVQHRWILLSAASGSSSRNPEGLASLPSYLQSTSMFPGSVKKNDRNQGH